MNADNLPALTGSEKQIKWASDIRAKFVASLPRDDYGRFAAIEDLDAALQEFAEKKYKRTLTAEEMARCEPIRSAQAVARKAIDDVLAQTASRYWIDNESCAAHPYMAIFKMHNDHKVDKIAENAARDLCAPLLDRSAAESAAYLLKQAAQFRAQAATQTDAAERERLEEWAKDYESEAEAIKHPKRL